VLSAPEFHNSAGSHNGGRLPLRQAGAVMNRKEEDKIPLEEFNEKTQKDIKSLKYENITDALFFIVTGIAVLQKLCAAPPETKDMIRNLRLHLHIENKKERSWLVRKILKEMI
jgi:hypothetical protein